MQNARIVGRAASAQKYDVLTALGAHALAGDAQLQRIALRLMTLITARYNWAKDELVVGRRELARLWCVTERTVKREMAVLRTLGWLEVKRPSARNRITAYRIRFDVILRDSCHAWPNVGPDFQERLATTQEPSSSVVPFPKLNTQTDVTPMPGQGGWTQACSAFEAHDKSLYSAWIAPLKPIQRQGSVLVLLAPSRFHAHYVSQHLLARLSHYVCQSDPGIRSLSITCEQG